MRAREKSLDLAMTLLEAGRSVDVVGIRGSGKSTFLRRLTTRLEARDWLVHSVGGIAALRTHPGAAIALSGIVDAPQTRHRTGVIEDVAWQLIARLRSHRCVVVVDDWNDLDDSSRGVIEFVRGRSHVPIVAARMRGAVQTRAAAATVGRGPTIELGSLGFDDLDDILSLHLGAPMEAATSRRVFAKCGGNVGLSLALVDATRRDGRLVLGASGAWTAVGELWSAGLRPVVESHLEGLESAERDALEMIAMIGPVDVDAVRRLVDWRVLEMLEHRGMIAFACATPGALVSVVPPLLVSFFRHATLSSRRIRLTQRIESFLGEGVVVPSSGPFRGDRAKEEDREMLFVGMARERTNGKRTLTALAWESSPTVATAIAYVEALMRSPVDGAAETIADVFARTDEETGDCAARAAFCRLRALWLAHGTGAVAEAVALLEARSVDLDVYGRVLDATRMSILADLDIVPAGFEEALTVPEDGPESVRLAVLEARMHLYTAGGRLDAAEETYRAVRAIDPHGHRAFPRVLAAMCALARGSTAAARRDLLEGWERARGTLDLEALHSLAMGLSCLYLHSGDLDELGEIVDVALSTGAAAPLPPGVRSSIQVAGTVRAAARGQMEVVRKYAAAWRAERRTDGALPGQSSAWIDAMVALSEGAAAAAADILWEDAARMEARGAFFAAQVQALAAMEIAPVPGRWGDLDRLVARTPEARTLVLHRDYLRALEGRDGSRLLEVAREWEAVGRHGVALAAYGRVAEWADDAGDASLAATALAAAAQVRSLVGGHAVNVHRFGTWMSLLTPREREIAELVESGLGNREIAERLVVSVRTVESHVLSVMRKLDVTSREHIERRLSSAAP